MSHCIARTSQAPRDSGSVTRQFQARRERVRPGSPPRSSRSAAMAKIVMPCPTTGTIVATGQHVSPPEFEATPDLRGSFRCSSCGRIHSWTRAGVRLTSWPGATSLRGL